MFSKNKIARKDGNTFCIISPNFFKDIKGGSEIQTYFLGQELVRRKWNVHFIRENLEKKGGSEIVDGMDVHSLKPARSFMTWMNISGLYRIMKKVNADMWYCRAARTYVFSVWLLSKILGGKVIWACSSDVYVTKELGREWEKKNILVSIIFFLDKRFFIKAIRNIDLVLLQTYNQKTKLKENWNIDGTVIRNGYPLPEFTATKRQPVILWIGNLRRLKHPEKFVQLAHVFQDRDYRFRIIGKEMGFPFLTEIVRKADRTYNNFEYLGEQELSCVHLLLKQAKLVVHTGEYEGFSNVFIEAWLFGVPVVSLHVDPDGIIKKNNLGRISHSMDQMKHDIQEIMNNPFLWTDISGKARRFAIENFNIIENVDTLLECTKF